MGSFTRVNRPWKSFHYLPDSRPTACFLQTAGIVLLFLIQKQFQKKRSIFWDITQRKLTEEEQVACIFRVEEEAKQETGVKQIALRWFI
jgi:hypothetical protein